MAAFAGCQRSTTCICAGPAFSSRSLGPQQFWYFQLRLLPSPIHMTACATRLSRVGSVFASAIHSMYSRRCPGGIAEKRSRWPAASSKLRKVSGRSGTGLGGGSRHLRPRRAQPRDGRAHPFDDDGLFGKLIDRGNLAEGSGPSRPPIIVEEYRDMRLERGHAGNVLLADREVRHAPLDRLNAVWRLAMDERAKCFEGSGAQRPRRSRYADQCADRLSA